MICIYIYPSTYDICVQMTFPKNVLVHIWDGNYELICQKGVSCSL